MTNDFDGDLDFDRALAGMIPDHMQDGLRRYIEHGIPPGHFLTAVLQNDLRGACERADFTNRSILFKYIQFLYNYAPPSSWGSPERFKIWVNHRGMEGLPRPIDSTIAERRQAALASGAPGEDQDQGDPDCERGA